MLKAVELANKIIKLNNKLHENHKVYAVGKNPSGQVEGALQAEDFFEVFTDYEVAKFSDEYPYEVSSKVENVKFFALLTESEYQKYVKEE